MVRILAAAALALFGGLTFTLSPVVSGAMVAGHTPSQQVIGGDAARVATTSVAGVGTEKRAFDTASPVRLASKLLATDDRRRSPHRQRRLTNSGMPTGAVTPPRNRLSFIYIPQF